MDYNNEKQIYTPLEMEVLAIQMERGYAGSSTGGGENAVSGTW